MHDNFGNLKGCEVGEAELYKLSPEKDISSFGHFARYYN
jgi:hypothetical protein